MESMAVLACDDEILTSAGPAEWCTLQINKMGGPRTPLPYLTADCL